MAGESGQRGGPRVGSGRPEAPEARRQRVTVMLTEEEQDRLAALATERRSPRGTVAHELLRDALSRPSASGLDPHAPPSLPGPRLVLSSQQQALHDYLYEIRPTLAEIYRGGLTVLSNADNPEAVPQACHSFRELMEKLPDDLDVPMRESRIPLRTKVNELQESWEPLRRRRAHESRPWRGTIDSTLRKFLIKASDFFSWYTAHFPKRKAEARKALRRMDPSADRLPDRLEDIMVDRWSTLRDFFNDVSHHRKTFSLKAAKERLENLERLILERARPETFADFDRIDQLITEGSDDA